MTESSCPLADWEISQSPNIKFDQYWAGRTITGLPLAKFSEFKEVWLDLGAGSGDFFLNLAPHFSNTLFVPIERCRTRGKTLARRTQRVALNNFCGIRGNAIAHLAAAAPDECFDRIYILYPCPWPKNSQRKNRWYFHPLMRHIFRTLKTGGHLIWTSDQKFYIDEAHYTCLQKFPFKSTHYGQVAPNKFNHFDSFEGGRTKFERDFLSQGLPCYELVLTKSSTH